MSTFNRVLRLSIPWDNHNEEIDPAMYDWDDILNKKVVVEYWDNKEWIPMFKPNHDNSKQLSLL
jgi:hypothetical protein